MTSGTAEHIRIRAEIPRDIAMIRAVTAAAFAPVPYSDGSEPRLVDRLREDGDLTISLVAEAEGGTVVGHIAFSPVATGNGAEDWHGLGPVSVDPRWQGRGIGRALIEAGLAELERLGAAGCILVGDPQLYARFGFTSGALRYGSVEPKLVQHITFGATPAPSGDVTYAAAFNQESRG